MFDFDSDDMEKLSRVIDASFRDLNIRAVKAEKPNKTMPKLSR